MHCIPFRFVLLGSLLLFSATIDPASAQEYCGSSTLYYTVTKRLHCSEIYDRWNTDVLRHATMFGPNTEGRYLR